jgi:hypothetical protein
LLQRKRLKTAFFSNISPENSILLTAQTVTEVLESCRGHPRGGEADADEHQDAIVIKGLMAGKLLRVIRSDQHVRVQKSFTTACDCKTTITGTIFLEFRRVSREEEGYCPGNL